MSTLRIREKSKVRELNIPKDVLEVLEKIVSSNTIMDKTKHATIRKLTDGSPCCICSNGIPAYEVVYPVPDRLEAQPDLSDIATIVSKRCTRGNRFYSIFCI